MLRIRLARGGSKKRPFYHIVAAEKHKKRDGRFVERLGYFNPVASGGDSRLLINLERLQYWVKNGAQPTERVLTLVKEYEQASATA